MATTATGAVQGPRGVAPLVRTAPAESRPGQLSPGDVVSSRSLVTIEGESIQIPESQRLVHLQFRRYAGCPVCNLHLRTVAKRHDELVDAGITEVVVFHSTAETMVRFQADLPFAAVADPERHLYREFGVSKKMSARSALNPRTWRAAGRALAQAPNLRGAGGMGEKHNGLPADFLIESDGRVIAANYGRFIDDHWSVDDVLELAGGVPLGMTRADSRQPPTTTSNNKESQMESVIQRVPRNGPTVFGFLLAMLLLPIGATLAPFGIGIPIFAIGLAGLLRD